MKSNSRARVEPCARFEPRAAARLSFAVTLLGAGAAGATAPSEAVGEQHAVSGLAALSVGRGLRFNNPYRLETPLGDTAESVSLSATYLDASLAMLLGGPTLEQGFALSGVFALDGIGQFGVTPSYLAQLELSDLFAARGRLGLPLVVAPDTTLGLEAALGSNLLIAHGLGLTAELVASVFFGAATEETATTTIPMLSLQIGIIFEHGVM
jgi:hypothetical protein